MMDATGMLVVGHGVDLIEVSRIERMLQEHGERFCERVFTATERAYASAGGARRRWCADAARAWPAGCACGSARH